MLIVSFGKIVWEWETKMKLRLLWTVWTLALSVTPVLADDFIVGQTYTFYSSVLDEDQTYTVNLPAGYNDNQAYPVVYLLDGYETQIRAVSGLAHALNGIASSMPQVIVVALPSNNRLRDYLPSDNREDADGSEVAWLAEAGGGENYFEFLEKELFPHIEESYSTLNYRLVIGHSAGATLALSDLMDSNPRFNGYIVIDPPVVMQGRYLLKLSESAEKIHAPNRSLYLSYVPHGDGSLHKNLIGELLAQIKEKVPTRFDLVSEFFEEETHQSVQVESYLRGFQAVFRGYKPPAIEIAAATPSALVQHYEKFSERMGVNFKPDPTYTNIVAYNALNYYGWMEQAKALFQINIDHYPTSHTSWSGIGDYYATAGEEDKAREAFEHALELNPSYAYARQRLQEIDQERSTIPD